MCVQTYPCHSRSKSEPSKHIEINHNDDESSTSSSSSSSSDDSTQYFSSSSTASTSSASPSSSDGSTRRRKFVSFDDVVFVRSSQNHNNAHHHPNPKASAPAVKKSVSFHEKVMVRPVLHIANYTDKEIRNCWSEHAERKRTKTDIVRTIRLFREGNSKACTRGLEKLLDGGHTLERRDISIQAVLDEQEFQRNSNTTTSSATTITAMAKTYKPYSRSARHVAQAMAKIDEIEVMCQRLSPPHNTRTRRYKPKTAYAA